MNTKLTLNINENVIERAKEYAKEHSVSLSKLIENYLNSLTREKNDEFEISPFVRSISSGKSIPKDGDWKILREDYIEYLEEKYR